MKRTNPTLAVAVFACLGATAAWAQKATRTEHNLLGEMQIPADAYYGVQTARVLENFQTGKCHDQFQVDWFQGGAGTSTNMNANEVLANIALELSGPDPSLLEGRAAV